MIAIGSDHGGFSYKEEIKTFLTALGYEYKDFGTFSADSCDYPDIAKEVASAVSKGDFSEGILICGTGIGMSIAANKVKGIRAAHVTDTFSARMSKEHNNAQIVCIGERITKLEDAKEIVKTFLTSSFAGDRHIKRVEKIMAIEKD